MYCGNGQNERKKKFKSIIIIHNIFYTVHPKVPNLPRRTENNKIIIIIIQNGKSTNKIINNLCIVGMATFKLYKNKLNT